MIMIRVTTEYYGFWQLLENSWSGARDVLSRVQEQYREDEAMERIADYCDMVQDSTGAPPSDTEVNDYIWFELPYEMNLYDDEEEDEEDADVYTSDTGKHFALQQQPYLDGAADTRGYYTATATCREDGRTYRLYWDILDDYDAAVGDESNACDWDTITDYEVIG